LATIRRNVLTVSWQIEKWNSVLNFILKTINSGHHRKVTGNWRSKRAILDQICLPDGHLYRMKPPSRWAPSKWS
jgi:hypothetical protein